MPAIVDLQTATNKPVPWPPTCARQKTWHNAALDRKDTERWQSGRMYLTRNQA